MHWKSIILFQYNSLCCGGTSQLVAAHNNELYRDYVLGFWEGVNNVTKCLQHYISKMHT